MIALLRHINPLLRIVGLCVVPDYIGFWYVRDGEIKRRLTQTGWRLARTGSDELPSSPLSRMWAARRQDAV